MPRLATRKRNPDHPRASRQRELGAEMPRLRPECEDCLLIAELSRERDAVTRQAAELVKIDRLKSELYAEVSHEFRTPLTLILGPLRDLHAGECGELPAGALKQVEIASRNAERLQELVEQILDTALLDAGELKLRVRRVDLGTMLADLAERFHALDERSRASLVFAPPAAPIAIWCDQEQLEKVFSNLLVNALHYSPRDSRVEMAVEHSAEADTVAVTVRDHGPGIAPEDQQRIFDRYYRGPPAAGGSQVGIGLGLPVALRLVEAHRGSLTLTSAVGEGCVFRVELRLGRDHFAPAQLVDDSTSAPAPGGRRPRDRHRSERRPGGHRTDRDPADRTTVLVVDNNPGIRAFVRSHLEARYRVEEAADGVAALALARELLPDLVVSDVMMPEMDGYALCRALKEDPELDWVPVVLLTVRAAADDKLEGLRVAADDYLTKPFDVRELVARVENLIVSRRRLKQRFGAGGPPLRLPVAPGVRPTAEERRWLARVRGAIETGLGEDAFSVADLAAALAVDRSHLYKRLRRLTGCSPSELVADCRLRRAESLLRGAAGSVSEVAYAAGFESVAHFSRRFHERFGLSPSAWRRRPPT